LSSRPERTRISCLAPLDKTACAPFFKERRILFASATNFYRKSGGAERRDLCVDAFSWKCFSTERREGSAVSLSSIAEAEEENCRSLHGKPGRVGFARDDKKERVVERERMCRRTTGCYREHLEYLTIEEPNPMREFRTHD
jgi:hypothetical protein